jgi:hypothetical protein
VQSVCVPWQRLLQRQQFVSYCCRSQTASSRRQRIGRSVQRVTRQASRPRATLQNRINDPMPGAKDHVTKSWQPTLADMGIEHSDYVAQLKGDDADTGPIMMPKNIDSVQKWGDCVIRHGTKHADKTYRETYDENVGYRKWILCNAKGDHMNDFKQYVRARNRLTKLLETSKKDAETANHERECDDVFEKK